MSASGSASVPPTGETSSPSSSPPPTSNPPTSQPPTSAPPTSAPPTSAPTSPTTTPSTTPATTPTSPTNSGAGAAGPSNPAGAGAGNSLPNTNTQTVTNIQAVTPSGPSSSSTAVAAPDSKGFFENKAAVGATFGIVGLVAVGIIFMLITMTMRKRRARAFDREVEEEVKRTPAAPPFMDDDDYAGPGYGAAAGAGYSAYAAHPDPDPYAARPGPGLQPQQQQQQYGYATSASDYPHSQGHSDAHTQALSGEGTPSNYMYPSGYSDLGFSATNASRSSHGTYSQAPMDGQYTGVNGHGGYAAHDAYGYAQPQQAYIYPGDESSQGIGSSTTLATSASPPPPSNRTSNAMNLKAPQYADGYVAQYQPRVVQPEDMDDEDAYGGVAQHASHHGHIGGAYEDEEPRGKVLKVANE